MTGSGLEHDVADPEIICDRMAPIAKERRNADLLKDKSLALLSLVLGAVEHGEGGSETGDG